MLKVHTNDGLTLEVDLQDEEAYKVWSRRFNDPAFQSRVTGMTVVSGGVQYSLPRPQGFPVNSLFAEPVNVGKGGERVLCFAGNVQATLTVYNGQRAARVTLSNPGRRRIPPSAG